MTEFYFILRQFKKGGANGLVLPIGEAREGSLTNETTLSRFYLVFMTTETCLTFSKVYI